MIRARAPGAGNRRRDARRRRAGRRRSATSAVPDSRLSGTANLLIMPTPGCRQHLLQPAEGRRRRTAGRPDPAGHVQADPCGGAQRDRTRHRQPERAGGGGGAGAGQAQTLRLQPAVAEASLPRDSHALAPPRRRGPVPAAGRHAGVRAGVGHDSIKALFAWIAALGGLSLALLLILTGRGGIALGALTLFGPLIYRKRWRAARGRRIGGTASRGAGAHGGAQAPRARSGAMTRQEAYEVLGLHPGASRGGDPRGPSPPDARRPSRRRRIGLARRADQSGARHSAWVTVHA